LVQQLRLVPVEFFVMKPHVTRRLRIDIGCQDGIAAQLAKAIKVQLPRKAAKVGMFEVQR